MLLQPTMSAEHASLQHWCFQCGTHLDCFACVDELQTLFNKNIEWNIKRLNDTGAASRNANQSSTTFFKQLLDTISLLCFVGDLAPRESHHWQMASMMSLSTIIFYPPENVFCVQTKLLTGLVQVASCCQSDNLTRIVCSPLCSSSAIDRYADHQQTFLRVTTCASV